VLNGGITTTAEALEPLRKLDGVMLGRAAYHTPWLLAELQKALFGSGGVESREEAVEAMSRYISRQSDKGVPVKNISRHVLGLFQGLPGAKRWRRYISENAHLDGTNDRLLLEALDHRQRGIAVAPGSVAVHGNALE
jgi:tRNA-dihydrouridine synthase A